MPTRLEQLAQQEEALRESLPKLGLVDERFPLLQRAGTAAQWSRILVVYVQLLAAANQGPEAVRRVTSSG